MTLHSTPAHKQRDPAMQPGQIVNPIPKDHVFNHDMMDDMGDEAVYRRMHPAPKKGVTLGDYIRRKEDNHAGMSVTEGEALCSRIMR